MARLHLWLLLKARLAVDCKRFLKKAKIKGHASIVYGRLATLDFAGLRTPRLLLTPWLPDCHGLRL
ncbi:hypothetical protein AC629_33465 [Bradyrhizobium sp. NAS80.1]|nr:hypothetical protein AC629_33465 [Bradyrhizobium sp. NAS80.1]